MPFLPLTKLESLVTVRERVADDRIEDGLDTVKPAGEEGDEGWEELDRGK